MLSFWKRMLFSRCYEHDTALILKTFVRLITSIFGCNSHCANSSSCRTFFSTSIIYVQQGSILTDNLVALVLTGPVRIATIGSTSAQIINWHCLEATLTNTLWCSSKSPCKSLTPWTFPSIIPKVTMRSVISFSKVKTLVPTNVI